VTAKSAIGASYEMRHERSDGYLVYAERSRRFQLFRRYDRWRAGVCQRRRSGGLWVWFREGRLNPLVLGYAMSIKIRGY
jgi:hypothetical protein